MNIANAKAVLSIAAAIRQNRRRHARVKVSLFGRYMLSDRRELPCQTIDASAGGLSIAAPVRGDIGQRVVIYLEHLGRLEGQIVRHIDAGFALQLHLSPGKREIIADKLTWLANRRELGLPEDRRHDRIEPVHKRVQVTLADGTLHAGMLVDVSQSGASLRCPLQPEVGAGVTLGLTRARVVRHTPDGFAVEFLRLIPVETFDNRIKL